MQANLGMTRLFGPRGYAVGAIAALLTALVIGLPTAVVPNRFFTRMTPTRPQDYLFLALTALLVGVIADLCRTTGAGERGGPDRRGTTHRRGPPRLPGDRLPHLQ